MTIISESEQEIIPTETYNDYTEIFKNYELIKQNNTSEPKLTLYEKTKIIGLRAQQLANGANPLINVDAHISSVIEIAELELVQKKIPFLIKRKIGNKFEYWKIEDLQVN